AVRGRRPLGAGRGADAPESPRRRSGADRGAAFLRRALDRGDGRGARDVGLVGQAGVSLGEGVALPRARSGMNPENWRRIRQHFDESVDLPSDRRAGFLDALRAEDESLAREVGSLLASSEASGDFLEAPAVEQFRGPGGDAEKRSRIGAYTIRREIGHGGM